MFDGYVCPVLNAALNFAGGKLTMVACATSAYGCGSAIGQTANHLISIDAGSGCATLVSALMLPVYAAGCSQHAVSSGTF